MQNSTPSPEYRELAPTEYAYETETKALKRLFAGLAVFVVVVFSSAGLYAQNSIRDSFVTGFIFGAGLFSSLWIYGATSVFDRCYRIDSKGVSLSRRGVTIVSIRWSDIQSIARAHMVVRSVSGQRIAFNIPPSEQKKARSTIEEGMKKAAQPGATDNPDDAQRLREDH